jgi:glycosyltransferase involved in cell wall biosynthesis
VAHTLQILIPAFQPTRALGDVVAELLDAGCRVTVVDDGTTDKAGQAIIEQVGLLSGVTLLRHSVNRGKGAALKTGFDHIVAESGPVAITCADADGQHLPKDIVATARSAAESGETTLGVRGFQGAPIVRRLSNRLTAFLFKFASGRRISDTQTGLRSIAPNDLVVVANTAGERYEYEFQMLFALIAAGRTIREAPITTVYHTEDDRSHFRPIVDSYRIYAVLFQVGLRRFSVKGKG